MTSAGFHAKHLAGSTHRALHLSGRRLAQRRGELRPLLSKARDVILPKTGLRAVNAAFDRYDRNGSSVDGPRIWRGSEIGRKRIHYRREPRYSTLRNTGSGMWGN